MPVEIGVVRRSVAGDARLLRAVAGTRHLYDAELVEDSGGHGEALRRGRIGWAEGRRHAERFDLGWQLREVEGERLYRGARGEEAVAWQHSCQYDLDVSRAGVRARQRRPDARRPAVLLRVRDDR